MNMTHKQIQATGNFLNYYQTDLNYIKTFQDFKANKISSTDYIKKEVGTFYSFLIEFRVARNFSQGMADVLLEETHNFINGKNADDVDLFAEILAQSNLTRGKIMSSMASKILFLNNPWKIIPMDTLARKALNQKENKYYVYEKNLNLYREKNKLAIENCLNFTNPLVEIINKDYNEKLENLNLICENRIIDKMLWTIGK